MTRQGLRILVCTLVVAIGGAQHPALAQKKPPLGAPITAPLGPKPPALPTTTTSNETKPTGPSPRTTFDEAEDLYRSGDWEKALKVFQAFETKYPYSGARPTAQYYQGWCYFNLKRYDEAIKVITRLVMNYKEAPIVPEATLKMAECYREKKDFKAATQLYRDFQKKYKDNLFTPQAMMGEAWVLYKSNNLDAAKKVIYEVRQKYAHNPQVLLDTTFLLGQVLIEEKKFNEARDLFRRIAEQSNNPSAAAALYSLADSFYEAKNYADAIKYFKRVQSRNALLANISAQIAPLITQRNELVRIGADLGALSWQIQQLQTIANQINQREDLRAVALFRIANAYQELKRPEEASVVYRILVEKYPALKTAEYSLYGLIQSLTESKRLPEANIYTEQFKKQFPQSKMLDSAGYLQSISVFSSGNFQDALQRFERFLPTCKDPKMVESTEFYIAGCHYGLEEYPKAIELFNAFLKKHPNSTLMPDAIFRLGRSSFELAQRAEKPAEIKKLLGDAIQYYEQVHTKFSKYEGLPEVTFQLGYLYNYYGAHNEPTAYDKAIGAFSDIVQKWPSQLSSSGRPLAPEAWYQIARAHLAARRFDKAIEAYKKIAENYPDNELAPFAAFEAGSAYYDLKKPAEGLAALRAYIEKYPTHSKVGDVLFAIGSQLESTQPAEARAIYKDLIERTTKAEAANRDAWLNPAIESQRRIVNFYEKDNDIKGAVADCEAFLAKFADESIAVREIFSRLASLYRKAKLIADGYAEFDKLAQQYAKNPAFRVAAATSSIELALTEKDFPRAAATATKLLQDPEKDRLPAVTCVAIGNTFLKTEKNDLARDVFRKAIKLYPNDNNAVTLANLGLGQALLALKDFNGAETAFGKQMPSNLTEAAPEALIGLAKIYEEKGLTLSPTNAINVKAVQFYTIAFQSGRRDIANDAFHHLGNFFFNIKETDPAKDKENKKAALPYFMRLFFAGEPLAEEGTIRAAQCHEALGNLSAALSAYKTYVRRYPNGKFKVEANNRISELTPKVQPSAP